MEEVEDFEGFAPEDCDISVKLRTCIEQILKKSPSYIFTKINRKKKKGWKRKKLSQSPQLEQDLSARSSDTPTEIEKERKEKNPSLSPQSSVGQTEQTNSLKFWQLKELHSPDSPQTVLDHAYWFEKIMTACSDKEKYTDLTYQQYTKLASLEGSVNVIMFISASKLFTTQRLWEEHIHRITKRVSKEWMERELNSSPLFYLSPHRNVWERTGVKRQGGKKSLLFSS